MSKTKAKKIVAAMTEDRRLNVKTLVAFYRKLKNMEDARAFRYACPADLIEVVQVLANR